LAWRWPCCLPAHAQWKWRDKDGQVNVSDRPPPRACPTRTSWPGRNRNPTAPRPAGTCRVGGQRPPLHAAPTALEREVQARKRAAEQEQAAKAKAEEERIAAISAQNCRNARSQIAALESGQRIARMNEQGRT
jgi:hypothetical protein